MDVRFEGTDIMRTLCDTILIANHTSHDISTITQKIAFCVVKKFYFAGESVFSKHMTEAASYKYALN